MKKFIESFYTNRSVEEAIFTLLLFAGIPYFTINEIIDLTTNGNPIVLVINSTLLASVIYLLWLSKKGKLSTSHIFGFSLILATAFSIFWPSSTGLSGAGAYVLQSLIVVILLVNRGKGKTFFAIFLLIIVLIAGFADIEYTGKIIYSNQLISFMLNALIITLAMNLFKGAHESERRSIFSRISQLEKVNNTLSNQNETLEKNHEEIVRIQTQLQEIISERTKEIESENKRLIEYAFINAHLVRAPLANLMGLSELKCADNEDYKLLNQKIEQVDKVVRKLGGVLSIADKEAVK